MEKIRQNLWKKPGWKRNQKESLWEGKGFMPLRNEGGSGRVTGKNSKGSLVGRGVTWHTQGELMQWSEFKGYQEREDINGVRYMSRSLNMC